MVKVIPAILTDDKDEYQKLVDRCVGVADRVQVDFIDGQFADNKTISPFDLRGDTPKVRLDAHLMVSHDNVESWTKAAANAGFDRIICQVESINDQRWYVDLVKKLGAQVGLALDLNTDTSVLDEEVLNDLDVVLIMSVPAGFGGQKFDEKVLPKVRKLNKHNICVDGGITPENVSKVVDAGASEIAVGRFLFDGDLATNIKRYEKNEK